MLNNKKDLLILIPAFNEGKTIQEIIKKAKKYGDILIVDDGSKDETVKNSKQNGVKVISHKTNLGYNQAINTGYKYFLKKKYNKIISIDADGQLPPIYIKIFNKNLINNVHVVCGVRQKVTRFGEKFFIFFSKLFFGLDDPLCGLKGFTYNFIKKNYKNPKFDTINTELIIRAKKNSYKVKHIKIDNRLRKDESRFGQGAKINFFIIFTFLKCFFYINK
tara:strand:+ start:66 stop:722 length:657 start_codon:yes stop_codon:yes gene_type:complete